MVRDFVCYNCGQKNSHFSRKCRVLAQQFTRCLCGNVAFSAVQHKIDCRTPDFVSTKIGTYELPLMDFHNIRFKFKNVAQIYSAETTIEGEKLFLISKFMNIGTNIRLRQIYGQSELIIDMKIKPSITLGFGRYGKDGHLASLIFCNDQIRVNHYQHIDQNGLVSYHLAAKPKKSEHHDIELKLKTIERAIFFTIRWNNAWTANIAMSEVHLASAENQHKMNF